MAVQQTACPGCGATISRDARWCGRCGTAQSRAATTTPHAAPPHAHHRRELTRKRRIGSAVAVASVLVLAGTAAAILDDRPPPDPTVRVEGLAPPRTDPDPAARPTCSWDGGGHGSCGPTLLDDLRLVSGITPLARDSVLVAHRGGSVARLDLPEGRTRWATLPVTGADDVVVRADDGVVLLTHARGVARLAPSTGEVVWARQLADTPTATPMRAWALDGRVLVMAGDGAVFGLGAEDGTLRWEGTTGGGDAMLTSAGLLVVGVGGSSLWGPGDGLRWHHEDGITPRRPPDGERADGPLPLVSGGLLDPASGEPLDQASSGPTILRVAGPVTLQLRWPDRGPAMEVTALGPGGTQAWQADGIGLPCCLAALVPATSGRVAISSPHPASALLSLDDGTVLAEMVPPGDLDGAALVGVAGDLALWLHRDGLAGASFDGAASPLALPPGASIVSLDPLLVATASEVVAVDSTLLVTGGR